MDKNGHKEKRDKHRPGAVRNAAHPNPRHTSLSPQFSEVIYYRDTSHFRSAQCSFLQWFVNVTVLTYTFLFFLIFLSFVWAQALTVRFHRWKSCWSGGHFWLQTEWEPWAANVGNKMPVHWVFENISSSGVRQREIIMVCHTPLYLWSTVQKN